ncbi:Putative NADH:cytochrome b5 reductase, FAD-binding domain, ferredoxin reductase-type [Colletotrichum destructivum]|uniref:NADH:cytochrome b5 reductase, FAD-binding domain, ferredoxin reductase-type n=1 Tax=Colletotrichum destructivum TaxID=34406 RepID=A0AAX4I8P0_9PEZI|nr:Putative NADH:cytochrome b5 reductase, FAD-binding domain, ferredoxin reductase-type [Colletotrichum destructivum]
MTSSALASATGAAGRSVARIQRHQLRATSAAAATSRSITPTTLAHCSRMPRQFHSWQARRTSFAPRRLQSVQNTLTTTATTPIPAPAPVASRRLHSTTTAKPAHHTSKEASFISPRYLPLLVLLAVAGVAWDSQWLFPSTPASADPAEQTVLGSARRFVPFAVVAREQVSPTSFILTLKAPANKLPSVASLWNVFDLWCVEVKQPQIQVAREYTPLPPPPDAAADEDDTLRLYVRAVRGGEVSTYLSRLSPPSPDGAIAGDTVELRGPHGEFDLGSRLGGRGDRVVFLAGGTGIASALQAAHAVLPLPQAPSMTIFWAVRSRDEIHRGGGSSSPTISSLSPSSSSSSRWNWSWSWSWNPFSGRSSEGPGSRSGIRDEALTLGTEDPSPVSRELLALKDKYGDRLDVRVVVDQEGTAVRDSDLAASLTCRPGGPETTHAVEGCRFHSQTAHLGMMDGAPNAGKRGLFRQSDCACSSSATSAAPGKNVFVVSGPEGFVEVYAGAKVWRDGGQLQGPVGGILGALQRKNPNTLKDWIVLKL